MKKENVEIGECFGGTSCSGAADYEKHHSRSNGTALLYCVRTVKVTITKEEREERERRIPRRHQPVAAAGADAFNSFFSPTSFLLQSTMHLFFLFFIPRTKRKKKKKRRHKLNFVGWKEYYLYYEHPKKDLRIS